MNDLKSAVRQHWEDETCGTRYGDEPDRRAWFDSIAHARNQLEPYIPAFADFPSAAGLDVLEIGVGAGSDFSNWCAHARHATGVDLTDAAIALFGVPPERYTLQRADAEALPFGDASFDLVYSWGVLHHTPATPAAFAETLRVLKPGGRLKAMIYHVPSWTGFLLQVQNGWLRGNFGMTQKQALFDHLESPGTKAYTVDEARQLIEGAGYRDVRISTSLNPGDLMTIRLSQKYDRAIYRLIWRVYPRWFVRLLGDRFGLNLMIEARKPA
jgi:ubiquinone/menaquinone biosynthesis C-methylase UbiE